MLAANHNQDATRKSVVIGKFRKSGSDHIAVSLIEFEGRKFVDIRTATLGHGDELLMTAKGVSMRIDYLDELIRILQKARAGAVSIGWINERKAS